MSDEGTQMLWQASNPTEAQLLAGLLRSENITCFVEGLTLTDEFASSQRAMNLGSIKVFVQNQNLERAKELLAEFESGSYRVDDEELERQAMQPDRD